MVDQAADIAFFVVMAVASPLLLAMTACPRLAKDTPMVVGWNSASYRTPTYSFLSLIQPLNKTCSAGKDHNSTACITDMAACFTSHPGNSSYPIVVSSLISCKGRKSNGERKFQGS